MLPVIHFGIELFFAPFYLLLCMHIIECVAAHTVWHIVRLCSLVQYERNDVHLQVKSQWYLTASTIMLQAICSGKLYTPVLIAGIPTLFIPSLLTSPSAAYVASNNCFFAISSVYQVHCRTIILYIQCTCTVHVPLKQLTAWIEQSGEVKFWHRNFQ